MPATDFADFCGSLCEVVGAMPPALSPDEHGVVGFTVSYDGVKIGFAQAELGGETGVTMVAQFGAIDEAHELRMLRQLLDTNFMLSGICAPAFVRNPVTGEIALHQSWLLSLVNVPEVFEAVGRMASTVTRWKQGAFLEKDEGQGEIHPAWLVSHSMRADLSALK